MKFSKIKLAVFAVAALSFVLVGCGSDDADDDATDSSTTAAADPSTTTAAVGDGIAVSDAWTRIPVDGQTTSAVYANLTNGTDQAVTLVSASSPVTDSVELHETSMGADGQMQMAEKEGGFEIPAGGELVLEPGGNHIMLLGIDPATYPDSVEVTLTFDGADPITFDAPAKAMTPDAMSGSSMAGDMDHSDMGSSDMSSTTVAEEMSATTMGADDMSSSSTTTTTP